MNRRRFRSHLPLAACKAGAAALLTMASAGCPGSLDNQAAFLAYASVADEGGSGSGGDGMCDAPSTIFTTTCATASCHSASSAASAGNLDLTNLTPSNIASRLINQPASGKMSLLRINTADPAQSALLTKLASSPPYGLQMPYGVSPLMDTQIKCVTEWVNAQAAGGTASSSSGSSGSSGSSSSSSSGSSGSPSSSASSGSSSGSMEAGTVSFAAMVYPIIQGSCTGHHAGNTPSGGLDLSSESPAFHKLTTGSSSQTGCNESYVVSGNPMSSLLYQKVFGGTSIPSACGAQMPKGSTPVAAADVATIKEWIQGGAAP